MLETKNKITMKGNPLTLAGNEIKVGDRAPNFALIDPDMKQVTMENFAGKILILSTVPSLDTPVCDAQVRRFNQEAANLSKDMQILAISMDLPFAQKRWCGNAGVDRVKTLSDYKTGQFALDYGLLIEELQLIARAVLIIDKSRKVQYVQLVKEVSEQPDYESILKALKELVNEGGQK
jgi:thiol peroxidase